LVDYLSGRPGGARLQPDPASPAYDDYQMWLHYAEGSAMLPLMLNLYVSRLGDDGEPLKPRIESEIANHLGHLDAHLKGRDYLLGTDFSGADVQMSFIGEIAGAYRKRSAYPALDAWVKRLHARPAYQVALDKGGPYRFAN
jgi:glutathione S-transferase